MTKAVFLDRDGVINKAYIVEEVPNPPRNVNEVEILPGVVEAIKKLQIAGYELIVVTNQPDVARGRLTKNTVELIHNHLRNETGILNFYTCFHDNQDACPCRKPKPGLIYRAAKDFRLTLNSSFMVGDRWSDIEAGYTAGCRCFLIDYQYANNSTQFPHHRVASLLEAVDIILEDKYESLN